MPAAAPAEYMIFGFPGNQFNGSLAPALADLVDKGLIRVRDLLFIMKDADGNVSAVEIDEDDELKPFLDVGGDAGGLLTPEDVEHAAAALEPQLVRRAHDLGGPVGGRVRRGPASLRWRGARGRQDPVRPVGSGPRGRRRLSDMRGQLT